MNLHQNIIQLLKEIKPGQSQVTSTAYDTAWIARLYKLDEPIAEEALAWLRDHQLADGSWGTSEPLYHHDRLICTLAAIISLKERNLIRDRERIHKGLVALESHWSQLAKDPAGETIAFEMLFPTLMMEARSLGLINRPNGSLAEMDGVREAKLSRSPGGLISRSVSMSFSAEMAGMDGVHLLDIGNLQEDNGSVGFSPSATAYFSLFADYRNESALRYLRTLPTADGSIAHLVSVDVVEIAWTLWNFILIDFVDNDVMLAFQPHLDFLENSWEAESGVGYANGYAAKDSDTTSLVYEVLTSLGRHVDIKTVLQFEKKDYFRCFPLETNPSISANVHVLGALRQAGLKLQNPTVQKVRQFLQQQQTKQNFWIDKWQASPYYTTAHAIIICSGYDRSLVEGAVEWIIATQKDSGAWGYYMDTAEETAYCLQALAIWKRDGGNVSNEVLRRGADWLLANMNLPYPPLWIGKSLYSLTRVVRSAILSALVLVEAMTA